MRLVRSASSSLSPNVLGGLEALFGVPVIDTYGMTEAATQIAANPLQRQKAGSVGQPAGPEIAILDGEGRRLRSGKRGEIALRGPTITRGYDNDVAATASAFRDGWFRTGDLGYLDAEGYLFIVGRIKEIIHQGGQKVAPAEVEEALLSHPDVVEAAVSLSPMTTWRGRRPPPSYCVRMRKSAHRGYETLPENAWPAFKVPGLIRIVPRKFRKVPAERSSAGELSASCQDAAQAKGNGARAGLAPLGIGEWQLAKSWAELLDIDQIGVDQDVFALGVGFNCSHADDFASARSNLASILLQGYSRCADRCGARTTRRVVKKRRDLHCRAQAIRRRESQPRRRWPTAGVHCAGAHPSDRAGAPWIAPVQPSLRLSAAGAAERSRTRAEPRRGRAPAQFTAHGICLAGRTACCSHYAGQRNQIILRRRKSRSQGACRKFPR